MLSPGSVEPEASKITAVPSSLGASCVKLAVGTTSFMVMRTEVMFHEPSISVTFRVTGYVPGTYHIKLAVGSVEL